MQQVKKARALKDERDLGVFMHSSAMPLRQHTKAAGERIEYW